MMSVPNAYSYPLYSIDFKNCAVYFKIISLHLNFTDLETLHSDSLCQRISTKLMFRVTPV